MRLNGPFIIVSVHNATTTGRVRRNTSFVTCRCWRRRRRRLGQRERERGRYITASRRQADWNLIRCRGDKELRPLDVMRDALVPLLLCFPPPKWGHKESWAILQNSRRIFRMESYGVSMKKEKVHTWNTPENSMWVQKPGVLFRRIAGRLLSIRLSVRPMP